MASNAFLSGSEETDPETPALGARIIDSNDSKAEALKGVAIGLSLTLLFMPIFPRFWVSLAVVILFCVHLWQWVAANSKNSPRFRKGIVENEDKPSLNSTCENEQACDNDIEYKSSPLNDSQVEISQLTTAHGNELNDRFPSNVSSLSSEVASIQTRSADETDGKQKEDEDEPIDVKVRVTGLKIEGGGCTGGGVAKYKLEVATPQGEKWFVWHKYSDICKLHGVIEGVLETDRTRRSIFTRIVPSIPGTRRGYLRIWGVSRRLMKRRRGGLEEFFKRIFGESSNIHHRRLALRIPKVREFLKIPPEIKKRKLSKRTRKGRIIENYNEKGRGENQTEFVKH
mmetsp:Transcript_39/g.64  ORF Transcript_39/g.64 Transcript_39/m.64 type:complete len:341 (+) Transcript_39:256-1278(+)